MEPNLFQVDAFTHHPFSGNPAGVCLLERDADSSWMQSLAREMNLSETAFLLPRSDCFGLRWFTPTIEVELCGHATLASAHILWEIGILLKSEPVYFDTLHSGRLTCKQETDWIAMDFPSLAQRPCAHPPELAAALQAVPIYVGKTEYDLLVELESEESVRSVQPNFGLIANLAKRGVIVTSLADSREYDFVSRFFAPSARVAEDPATGSAHCALGPYWSERLGKESLVGYQASQRGGVIRTAWRGDRVTLSGQAITVFEATLRNRAKPAPTTP